MYFQREKEVVLFDFLPLRTNVALEMMVFDPKNCRNLVSMGAVGASAPMLSKRADLPHKLFKACFYHGLVRYVVEVNFSAMFGICFLQM